MLSKHVRDVVAEKNDAVQSLSHWQGRVAGLESELQKVTNEKDRALGELDELRKGVKQSKQEQ